jgi:integrase/recombinase XerD
VLPTLTWFANIDNVQTRRTYQNDVQEFMALAGIDDPHVFRLVGRGHVLAWRKDLEKRAWAHNHPPQAVGAVGAVLAVRVAVRGQRRPRQPGRRREAAETRQPGRENAGDRRPPGAPDASTLQGQRDRAILATLLYHGLRRAELCALRLFDLQDCRGVRLQVHGKGSKIRYVPLHPAAAGAIAA